MRDLFGEQGGRDDDQVVRVVGGLVDVELHIHAEGVKAWRVSKGLLGRPFWLPKSQAELHGGVFTLPRWLAQDRGLL